MNLLESRPRYFILFGTPRSGSSPYYAMISHYFAQTGGAISLGEYFDCEYRSVYEENNSIKISEFKNETSLSELERRQTLSPETLHDLRKSIYDYRIELLKKFPKSYFFKLFSHEATEHLHCFRDCSEWFFVERKNLYQQMLSFMVSLTTNEWYRPGGLKIKTHSIQVQQEQFEYFAYILWSYFAFKKLINPHKVLSFEDLNRQGPKDIMKKIGLKNDVDWSSLSMTEVQSRGDKEKFFTNLEEMKSWYQNSFLQEIHRI